MAQRKTGIILPPGEGTPLPMLWTGDAGLDHMLEVAGFKGADLELAWQRVVEALDATTPKVVRYDGKRLEETGADPDHAIRLRAAEDIFGWLGFRAQRQRPEVDPGAGRTITINIITGEHGDGGPARPPAPNGGTIRVISSEGAGPENGHAQR